MPVKERVCRAGTHHHRTVLAVFLFLAHEVALLGIGVHGGDGIAVEAIAQAIQRLRMAILGVARGQHLAGAHQDQQAAIGMRGHAGRDGDRLGHAIVFQSGQWLTREGRVPVCRVGIVQVEPPDIAVQVTGIDIIDHGIAIEIHCGGAGESIGHTVAAGRGDLLDEFPGLDVQHEQCGRTVALVIAIANDDGPAGTAAGPYLGNDRSAVTVAEVGHADGIGGDLPEKLAAGVAKVVAGDVQGEEGLASGAQSADQHAMRAAVTEGHIGPGQFTIDEELVLSRIRGIGKGAQTGYDRAGDIGETFLTRVGIEGVQHAVVGTDEQQVAPQPGGIVVVAHVEQAGLDDVTQDMDPLAEVLAFLAAIPAQKIDQCL